MSATQNVVRYTALLTGIVYGFSHARTVQKDADEHAVERANARRADLINQARQAWTDKQAAAKSAGSGLITNPDDPKFDLEKLLDSYAKA